MCQNISFCQVCPLNCSFLTGVIVPDHLRHLTDVPPQLQVFAMGVLLGAPFLSEDGEELRSGSWFFGGRNAHGSSPGSCDDSGIDVFRGLR